MRTLTEKKQLRINFLKENETEVRKVYENNLSHNSIEFLYIIDAAKSKGLYSLETIPRQIYINLLNICSKDIGWNFYLKK